MFTRRCFCALVSVGTSLIVFPGVNNASPTPIPALPSWLTAAMPTKGDGIPGEIKCYGLPYGGIGFTSHVLTYYTLCMLSGEVPGPLSATNIGNST